MAQTMDEVNEEVSLSVDGTAGEVATLTFVATVPDCYSGPGDVNFGDWTHNGAPLDLSLMTASLENVGSGLAFDGSYLELDGCPEDATQPAIGTFSPDMDHVARECDFVTGRTVADGGAGVIAASGARHVAYVGTGGAMLPLLLFASARAAVPVTPLNYRLSADGLRALLDRLPDPLVVVDDEMRNLIHEQASEQKLEKHARLTTPSIRADGVANVLAGNTTLEEVLRVTREG